MLTLNIIGAGNLGRTLGRLWQQQGYFRIQSVCNRSRHSAESAVDFIGGGRAADSIDAMDNADCWLIATGDTQIGEVAETLAGHLHGAADKLVFHCSGALSSGVLANCRPAAVASAHPVHSFADPALSVRNFAGTSVALEGDTPATDILRGAFAALGCKLLSVSAEKKSLYHAGSVFACNYLSALMDLSLRSFAAAGIGRADALQLLAPIVQQTAQNNLQLGPEKSLTGPIARGDRDTVATQLAALENIDSQLALNYRHLGLACVELARRSGLSPDDAAALTELLQEPLQ